MMATSASSPSGVASPCRNRTSCSSTKIFTKLCTRPSPSTRRALIPGNRRSRSSTRSTSVVPLACTTRWSPVSFRNGAGILTFAIFTLPQRVLRVHLISRCGDQIQHVPLKVPQGRADGHRRRHGTGHGLKSLQPLPGDVGNHHLVAPKRPPLREG